MLIQVIDDAERPAEPHPQRQTAQPRGTTSHIQKQARIMKQTLSESEATIGQVRIEIDEGTDATILNDKMNFIRELLTEKLELIDFKIKKHISEQKEKNNQLVELIGIVKNQKLRLQDHLALLESRLSQIEEKIGLAQHKF